MKNTFFLLFPMLFLISACDKEKMEVPLCEDCNFTCLGQNEPNILTNDCQDNWDCSFRVRSQSKIALEEPQGVSSGDKHVFQMIRSTEGEEAIADDEFTEILVFELEASQNSFSVEEEELQSMQVHFRRVCFCSDVNFRPVTEGCLQGEKQEDGSWFVQGYFGEGFEFGVEARFEN